VLADTLSYELLVEDFVGAVLYCLLASGDGNMHLD